MAIPIRFPNTKRRFTLVFHDYIHGNYGGAYVIRWKRTVATEEEVRKQASKGMHFYLEGWPQVYYADGAQEFQDGKPTHEIKGGKLFLHAARVNVAPKKTQKQRIREQTK